VSVYSQSPSFHTYLLHLLAEGWPGRVDLAAHLRLREKTEREETNGYEEEKEENNVISA